jgi:signal transduction histidine kinase
MARVVALWDRLDPRWVDAAIALVLTVVTQIQVADAGAAGRGALLLTLAVAFRRTAPLLVALVVAAGAALQGLSDNPPSVLGEYLTITLAVYTAAAHLPLRRAVLAGLAIAAGIVVHDIPSDEYGSLSGVLSDLSTPALFWAVGRAVRLSRSRADKAREAAAAAVESERRHIARELHDVVTHSLGIVVLQAEAAHRFIDGREPEVAEALGVIETSGRTAMTEMRRLLGLLRDEGSEASRVPLPSLAHLPELARQVGAAGLPVSLTVSGDADVPAGLDLSAYRIVQEALTNALRHGRAGSAAVVVRRTVAGVTIEVSDDGAGPAPGARTGRGLLGMRERAALFGGTLEHGARDEGGYRVAAWLPLGADGGR